MLQVSKDSKRNLRYGSAGETGVGDRGFTSDHQQFPFPNGTSNATLLLTNL